MIAYLRSKRQLIARNTELAALVAKQTDEIAARDEELTELNRALTALRDSFDRTRIKRELADEVRGQTALQSAIDAGVISVLPAHLQPQPLPHFIADDAAHVRREDV